jgi:hypothetical protein
MTTRKAIKNVKADCAYNAHRISPSAVREFYFCFDMETLTVKPHSYSTFNNFCDGSRAEYRVFNAELQRNRIFAKVKQYCNGMT